MCPPRPEYVLHLSMHSVFAPSCAAATEAMAPANPQPTTSTSTSSVPVIWSAGMSAGGVMNDHSTAALAPKGLPARLAESIAPLAVAVSSAACVLGAQPARPAPAAPRLASPAPMRNWRRETPVEVRAARSFFDIMELPLSLMVVGRSRWKRPSSWRRPY